MTGVHVAGIGITPFGKHGDTALADLGVAAAERALADAGLGYDAVGEVFTSSSMAPPQTGLKVAHRLGRTGIPVTAIESASAAGWSRCGMPSGRSRPAVAAPRWQSATRRPPRWNPAGWCRLRSIFGIVFRRRFTTPSRPTAGSTTRSAAPSDRRCRGQVLQPGAAQSVGGAAQRRRGEH